MLASVKQRVGHGGFELWVRTFTPFSPRASRRYIKIAKQWGSKPVETGAAPPVSKYHPDEVKVGRPTQQSAERSFAELNPPKRANRMSESEQVALVP